MTRRGLLRSRGIAQHQRGSEHEVGGLGGFDEIFNPYYAEDVDLGIRAWKVGYKCYYDDTALCRHPLSATIQKEQPKKVKKAKENSKKAIKKAKKLKDKLKNVNK